MRRATHPLLVVPGAPLGLVNVLFKRFVKSLTQLLVKDASFLVNLDNRCASEVSYHPTGAIAVVSVLLSKTLVARILFRELLLVADGDMGIDQGVGGCDVHESVGVVNLGELVEIKLAGTCLGICICDPVRFFVSIEDALADGFREHVIRIVRRCAAVFLTLKNLQLPNCASIAVCLAVDVAPSPLVQSRLHHMRLRRIGMRD